MEAITETEVARAASKLKNGKAAGADHIQPELPKQSYHTRRSCLTLHGRAKEFPRSGKMV